LGLNLIRIPVNYRHFEDDMNPFVIVESGFKHLDRVIALCARHEIYTIIDLHALPGYQNQDWHSTTLRTRRSFGGVHFQDNAVNCGKPSPGTTATTWVAGYNPSMNPDQAKPDHAGLSPPG
jgi:hypothetical protein